MRVVHAPGHFQAEVLYGPRADCTERGELTAAEVGAGRACWRLTGGRCALADACCSRGPGRGATTFSLADALYVELAAQLDTVVITTDRRLARATPLAVAPPD